MLLFSLLQVPDPHLNITLSSIADHFYPGLQLNLTCFIHLDSQLESILTVSPTWSKSGDILSSSEKVLISSPTQVRPLLYQTSLVIRRLGKNSDNGDYVCSARIVSNSDLVLEAVAEVSKTITVEGKKLHRKFNIMWKWKASTHLTLKLSPNWHWILPMSKFQLLIYPPSLPHVLRSCLCNMRGA